MLHWQKIAQELDGDAIRQQRGPSNFLTAWAGKRQFAKEGSHADLVMPFAHEGLLAVRNGGWPVKIVWEVGPNYHHSVMLRAGNLRHHQFIYI
jgi:hypothetical protein